MPRIVVGTTRRGERIELPTQVDEVAAYFSALVRTADLDTLYDIYAVVEYLALREHRRPAAATFRRCLDGLTAELRSRTSVITILDSGVVSRGTSTSVAVVRHGGTLVAPEFRD